MEWLKYFSFCNEPFRKNSFLLKQRQIDLFAVIFFLLLSFTYFCYLAVLGSSESAFEGTDTEPQDTDC